MQRIYDGMYLLRPAGQTMTAAEQASNDAKLAMITDPTDRAQFEAEIRSRGGVVHDTRQQNTSGQTRQINTVADLGMTCERWLQGTPEQQRQAVIAAGAGGPLNMTADAFVTALTSQCQHPRTQQDATGENLAGGDTAAGASSSAKPMWPWIVGGVVVTAAVATTVVLLVKSRQKKG